MSWLATLVAVILKALLNAFLQSRRDSAHDVAKEELGAAKQKQADTEAAIEAKRQADEVALQPPDRKKTSEDLRNGIF